MPRFTSKPALRSVKERNELALTWYGLLPGFVDMFRAKYHWVTPTLYPTEDAMADAWFGCQRAAELYDQSFGFTPGAYLWPWVQAALQRGLARMSNVRRPEMGSGSHKLKHLKDYLNRGEVSIADTYDTPDPSPGPVEEATKRERSEAVRRELERLPERYKTMLLLWAEGLNDKEIGERVGVSRQAVHHMRPKLLARLATGLTGRV